MQILSPKQLADLTRFHRAHAMLQAKPAHRSIEGVAWDCGYYDHAHLTNDFKRFTGRPPSTFILSDFFQKYSRGHPVTLARRAMVMEKGYIRVVCFSGISTS